MPWIIGIDEAGYGPNLGPFVMTAVACRVPEACARTDLWRLLRAAVRRDGEPDDGRLLVADSKQVYSPARGLRDLETGVLAALPSSLPGGWPALEQLLAAVCPAARGGLAEEPWYTGRTPLPLAAEPAELAEVAGRFTTACRQADVTCDHVRSVVICPAHFNAVLDRYDTKGAVLGLALAELLGCPLPAEADEPGGRNTYAAMLQAAFPEHMVAAQREGMDQSVYRLLGPGPDVRLTFQPRADQEHFCVALASMVSKYLRELLMAEFNQFWQARVPGLKPTAGYPGDAARFFGQIREAAKRLGMAETTLWRRK
jgi:hypothetical protein